MASRALAGYVEADVEADVVAGTAAHSSPNRLTAAAAAVVADTGEPHSRAGRLEPC